MDKQTQETITKEVEAKLEKVLAEFNDVLSNNNINTLKVVRFELIPKHSPQLLAATAGALCRSVCWEENGVRKCKLVC